MNSPLKTTALFHMGPVAITEPVIVTWAIMAFLTLFAIAVTRRLSLMPSKAQWNSSSAPSTARSAIRCRSSLVPTAR
jgi:hypothetical protein